MSDFSPAIPTEGIRLDSHRHLFLVDIAANSGSVTPERRAFLELGAAISFIGTRVGRLAVFLDGVGNLDDEPLFATIEEAFKSQLSDSYLVKFRADSTIFMKCFNSHEERDFEGFQRVYPPCTARH